MLETAPIVCTSIETRHSSIANEAVRMRQALSDLQAASSAEVTLIRCDSAEVQEEMRRVFVHTAGSLNFVTASISLRHCGLDALDDLTRELFDALARPAKGRRQEPGGLFGLLDWFVQQHGDDASERFLRGAEKHDATGDLSGLCAAYVDAAGMPRAEERRLLAWLRGTELKGRARQDTTYAALTERTAKRVLGELTRVLRALGFSGCMLMLTDADALVLRTKRQRQRAYIVLRELVDNFDKGHGMTSTRLVVCGGSKLFEGKNSIECLPPLLGRVRPPSTASPIPPHRSLAQLGGEQGVTRLRIAPKPPNANQLRAMRALIRIAQGLPPVEAVASMSVGYEKLDLTVTKLLQHAQIAGSVFTVLEGEYGSGKTHLLLHLADRALEQGHPVFRLNLERLNFDLGNPQRHLNRLLEDSELPGTRRPSALERLAAWVRSNSKWRALTEAIEVIGQSELEAAGSALHLQKLCRSAAEPRRAAATYLSGKDLLSRPGSPTYRQEAYLRFLLWLELLQRLEGCKGPVLLIDEAENLHTSGVPRSVRRTALRSLAFYCGGALPSACVVIATTPLAFIELKNEARELLAEVAEQRGALSWEDAEMLRRRLWKLRSLAVPNFTKNHRLQLARHIARTHRLVRGVKLDLDLERIVKETLHEPPRVLVRRLADELESSWWQQQAMGKLQV